MAKSAHFPKIAPGVDPPRKQCSTRIRFSDVSTCILDGFNTTDHGTPTRLKLWYRPCIFTYTNASSRQSSVVWFDAIINAFYNATGSDISKQFLPWVRSSSTRNHTPVIYKMDEKRWETHVLSKARETFQCIPPKC